MAAAFRRCALECYEGRISLTEFFRTSAEEVKRMAISLLKRWRAPPNVAVEDMAQEIRVGCIWAFNHYNPAHPKAAPIGSYVLYNAIDKAKKWLHKQRGVKLCGNADARKSRYAILFIDVAERSAQKSGREIGTHMEIEGMCTDLVLQPPQELAVVQQEAWRTLVKKAPTIKIRWALLALHAAHGEPQEAARVLYGNFDVRLRLRLASEKSAKMAINAAIRYLKVA